MPHDLRYECAYVFGAVCPARDTGVALILPDADTPSMNLHLAAVSTHVEKDPHAAIIIDDPGWHEEGGTLYAYPTTSRSFVCLPTVRNSTPKKISGNIFATIIWWVKYSIPMTTLSMAPAWLGTRSSPPQVK